MCVLCPLIFSSNTFENLSSANAQMLTLIAAGWFKIAEEGLGSDGKWGVDKLIANGGVQTITIPQCIAPGQYLLRGELIALHSASSTGGAQFYMVSLSPRPQPSSLLSSCMVRMHLEIRKREKYR